MRLIFALLLAAPALCAAPPAEQAREPIGTAKVLFCEFGGVGMASMAYDPEFAVGLVEIKSPVRISAVNVSGFELIGGTKTARLARVIKVEVFDEPYVSGKPYVYYESGRAHPWDGTLPAGTIRLRARVELTEKVHTADWMRERCKITVGPYVIEGKALGPWPT